MRTGPSLDALRVAALGLLALASLAGGTSGARSTEVLGRVQA
jgi:hypothetical protein